MRWIEVSIDAAPACEEAVANILLEEGCVGTAVPDSESRISGELLTVTGYFAADDRAEARLASIRSRIRSLPSHGLGPVSESLKIRWVEDTEWVDAWKKHFKPIMVGRVLITPSWETPAASPADVVVEIDPGMAFGTGHHETTRLCLLALQDRIAGGETVLDFGTGSGILAIAAAKLGAGHVTGIDIDPTAVRIAQDNVRRAGLEDRITIREADSPEAFEGEADIAVANILADTIINFGASLLGKTRPGGIIVASGIILNREADVVHRLSGLGALLRGVRREGEWSALEFERPREMS